MENPSEVWMQNLLSEHAESLINRTMTLEQLLARYKISKDSPVAQLMLLAERLYYGIPHSKPSPEFVQSLYDELVGTTTQPALKMWLRQLQLERSPLDRFREMPPHVQVAAGLLAAGFVFMASKQRRDALARFLGYPTVETA